MVHEVRGVVARAKVSPVTVESIRVPDPGPGERPVVPAGHASEADHGIASPAGMRSRP